MKKPTIFKALIAVVFMLLSISSHAQLRKNFTARNTTSLKGDILVIGNNILNRESGNRSPNDPYNSTGTNSTVNDNFNMKYIDIDNETSFNSSSATLTIPQASRDCFEIVYAALYWSGTYQGSDRSKINQIRLKTSATGSYKPLTGDVVWDEGGSGVSNAYASKPYACFKEVTAEVKAAGQGVYTVADLVCSEGEFRPGGNSAGWTIYIIYKDPKLPSKYITSFDGFSIIRNSDPPLDIPISGFRTNPDGNVNVKLAFSALEGDNALTGDGLEIKGAKSAAWGAISSLVRPITPGTPPSRWNPGTPDVPNFFNSAISDGDVILAGRTPSSTNTLGYDAGVVKIQNDGNNIIQNNETAATLRISTSSDSYYMFFNALAVEIIEPKIVLTKIVKNAQGDNIGGQTVTLGQQLNYEIGFKNTGNDNATSFTIRDQLPINIIFNYPADLVSLPDGVTVKSWDPATRNIVFDVRNDIVKVGLTERTIKFKVQVIPDCTMLDEACSNSIDNSAYATYKGSQNTSFTITDDPSVDTNTGCILVPKATNFLVGVDGCQYNRRRTLCTETTTITAAAGYSTYTWYSDKERTKVIGSGQTLTVKDPGVYYVYNLAPAPCRSIFEEFTVVRFGETAENPVLTIADEIVTCPNDGKKLPKIFLCGANASRLIQTGINDSSNIVWEKLDTSSCTAPSNENCANESTSCKWVQVATGPDFNAKDAGQYRLTINYSGSCFNRFYFNVFTNPLAPTEEHVDMICNNSGSITVRDVPAGYQYAIKTDPNATIQDWEWQDSNTFTIWDPNAYTVFIRQKGVTTNPCIFKIPNILIRRMNLALDGKKTDPVCPTDLGSASVGIQNFEGPYYVYLYNEESGQIEKTDGPVTNLDYNFSTLSYGTYGRNYRIRVTSSPINQTPAPKCDVSYYFRINPPSSQLKAFVTLQEPLTACSEGKMLLSASGGKSPYAYFINGSTTRVIANPYTITLPGTYDIKVVDDAGCSATTSITIPEISKPTFDVNHTSSACYDGTSSIRIENIVANGNIMAYSINDGLSYTANPIFSNLDPGNYKVKVRYSVTYTNANNQKETKHCFSDTVDITITGPTSALTASGGVAALAGCTLPDANGVKQGGKLRINNVEGGTPPYEYNFGDGNGWVTGKNEADVMPNPNGYILKVRDKLGCIFTIPYDIILEPKPADPTIDDPITVYGCDGRASSTVTVRNPQNTNYTYEYYIDGQPNTPVTNNVFTNIPAGDHTILVKYKVTIVPTYSNLLREDFGKGTYTTTPGINPAYCFEDETSTHLAPDYKCNRDEWINDGEYAVASTIRTRFNDSWIVAKDHTIPAHPLGRFLCVNVGGTAGIGGILYSKPIRDVIENQSVIISLWAENLIVKTSTSHDDPKLTIQLVNNLNGVGGAETIVATTDTSNPWRVPKTEQWEYKELTLNPGAYKNLSFVIRSYSNEFNGNDVLIDDIWVRQIPETCDAEKEFKVIVEDNKGFKADTPVVENLTCADKADGIITIAVDNFNTATGYYYTVNGGAVQNSSASPLVLNGLTAGNYTVVVQYDTAGKCAVTYTRTVTAPSAVIASATVTIQPTCIEGAIIKASATGGKPNYQYQLQLTDGTVVFPFQTDDTFHLPLTSTGNFVVVAKGVGDCTSSASDPVTVVPAVAPTASIDTNASDLCYDSGNKATLVVTVSGGKAPFSYSLDGQAFQPSEKFEGVGTGTHNIRVIDANGCEANPITNIVIGSEMTADAQVTKILDCTNSPGAVITITPHNGTPGYTYEVSTDGGTNYTAIASNTYPTTATGSFVFRVTDSKGCKAVTGAAIVNAKLEPTASESISNPKCYNGNDGSFTVTPSGGNGAPYTYSFNGSTTFGTSATLSGLAAGNYTYQVKDGKGCVSPVYNVSLINPAQVVASASFPANTTCSTSTVITVSGAGGTGVYTYSFGAGNTSYNGVNTLTVTNTNAAQTITYNVRDTNGCIDTKTITVPAFNPPTAINFTTPAAITCNNTRTSITLTTTGGIAPITYTITSGPVTGSNTTGVFNNLTPGAYTFSATDARGCSTTGSRTIDNAPAVTASAGKTDEVCFGANNGTATFTVSTNNFTYTITPNSGTATKNANVVTVTGLAAGTYTFVATDTNTGCSSAPVDAVIGAATAINFTVNASKINCSTTVSTLTITGLSGGSGGYKYAYAASPSTVPTTAYGSTLTVDTAVLTTTIDVYVKDTNGCIVKRTVSVLSENAPQINTPAAQCYTGTPVNILITGTYTGTPSYSINGTTYVPTNNFSLTPGTYTLYLKDGFGCPATTTYVVPEQLTIKTDVVPNTTCTPNTTISLSSTGGTGTVTYQVSYNGGTFVTAANPYTATAAGTYQFRVTDSKTPAPACSALSSVIDVTLNPTVLTINTAKVDVKCNGASTGSILVTPTSGKSPYTYSITKTTAPFTNYTVNNPSGLSAGTYNIVVTDNLGCTTPATASITITEPALLDASATIDAFTCNTSNTKESKDVVVTATGGTLPYTYSFNGGSYETSNTFTVGDNGNAQSVTYSVKDGNGCITTVRTINITPLNPPKIASVNATIIYCDPVANRTSTATITLTAGTGSGAPTYTIVSGPVVNATGATSGIFTGLTAGSYVFRATDPNGCFAEFSKNIPPVVSIGVTPTKLNDVYCHGDSTGNVRFNVFNFTGTYSYTVNSETPVTGRNETVFTLANRPAGTYDVVFVDETTNCTTTVQVIINEPAVALGLVIDSNVNANCGKVTSTVTVHATGGTPGYEYAILDADDTTGTPIYGPSAVFNINSHSGVDLNWVIYTKDSKGCITSRPVTIATDSTPTVTASVSNQCTASGSSFTIVAVGANGVAPYTYTINTGIAPSPANTFTVAAGTYTITVKDANGCTNTTNVTVSGAMVPVAVREKDLTCAAISPTDASIKITVTGGAQPFAYRVKVDAGTYTGTPIPFPVAGNTLIYTTGTDGTYQFEITDANGCIKETGTVIINPTTAVTANHTRTNPTCNAYSDGVVVLNALTGEAPFTYSFDGSAFGNKYIFGGLTAGSYNYAVRDVKGCEFTGTAVLTDPAPIVGHVTQTPIICNLNTLGTFNVDVISGGTAPYVYTLYNSSRTQIATYIENSVAPTTPYTFSGLDFGYYYITIVDANGCKFETPRLRIETPPYLDVTATVDSNNCATGVAVTVTTTGGQAPYRYSIFGQTETAPLASNSYTFTGLLHNTTYYLQVRDFNNCVSIKEVQTPPAPSTIKITGTAATDATCSGNANGTLDFTVEDYDPTVTRIDYRILDALTLLPLPTPIAGFLTGPAGGSVSHTINTLPAGNYVLQVTENTGTLCSTAYTFSISQPAQPLKANIVSVTPANCNNGAFVTIKTTGGTGPYYYGAAVVPAIPTVFTSTNNVLELDPNSGTDWNIIVRDSQGCEVPLGQLITVASSPVIALDLLNDCAAEGTFTVEVSATTGGVAPYSMSIDSDNSYASIPGLPHNVTNLSSGTHRIYIKDVNGCIDFKDININAPLNLLPAVINTPPTCLAINGGSITLTTTGGTGTYTYTINAAGAVVTNNVITNLAAGTYTVTVTDGVCNTTVPVELAAPIPVTFDAVVEDAACFGSNTGSITVNLLPGNSEPVYTYSIASATATPLPLGIVLVDNKFTNVPQGIYAITVTSGKGCPLTQNYTVGQPVAAVGATVNVDPYRCNNSNAVQQAVVTVTGTGGTAPYKYNFDGTTTYTDDNVTSVNSSVPQTVHYYVMDAKGCMYDNTVIVNPYQPLTGISFQVATAPVCPTNVADIRLVVSGGYTPMAKYEIISPSYRDNLASDTFTGLAPNVNYLFRVTDANGCYIEDNYTVDPVTPIDITRTSLINVSCNTANGTNNNGSATFTVSDFSSTGNYTISVSTNPVGLAFNAPTQTADVISLTGLVAGTYTVTVEDITTHCSESADVTITMPAPITFDAVATKVFCSEDRSYITVSNVAGGTSAYTYAVVRAGDPAPTVFTSNPVLEVDTNLTDLSWDVYVQDANLCISVPVTVPVIYNAPPVLNMPVQQCFVGADLTVDLDALSTTYNGVKSFTVNGLAVSSPATFTAAGTYKIILTDDNGCTDEKDYIVQPQLTAGIDLTKDLYCAAPINAEIDVKIKGGVGPYTYQMYFNGNPSGPLANTTGDFTASVAVDGNYHFVITDSNTPACSVTTSAVTVNPTVTPTLTDSKIDVSCFGFNDGSLTVVPSGGRLPYSFVLSGPGAPNTTGDLTGVYKDLIAGTYTVIATDSKNCASAPVTITIIQPDELEASHVITQNTSCSTLTEVVVTGDKGTGPYEYNFNGHGYDTENHFSVINDGSVTGITYTVKDANGCETSPVTIPIVPLNPPTDLTFTASAITCATGNSSNVSVIAENGVGQLRFEITEFNGAAPAVPYAPVIVADNTVAAIFNGLPFGDYMFKVTDSNGCSYTELLSIKDVVRINAANIASAMSCYATTDGKVTFTVSGFAGTYTYTITKDGAPFRGSTTTSDTEVTLTNLDFGDYEISIVDDITTCPITSLATVIRPSLVVITEIDNVNANCNNLGKVEVIGSGGNPGYTYSFVSTLTPGVFTDDAVRELAAGTWYAYAQDINGCISAPITITIGTDPLPANFTANVIAHCADTVTGNYEIVVDDSAAIGMAPFTYSIGGDFQSSKSFFVKVPKSYDLTVRDKFGCETTFPTAVTIYQPLELDYTILDQPSCTDNDGRISVSAKGGTGNYSYSIDGGTPITAAPFEFSGLTFGLHTIELIDVTTKCSVTQRVTLERATRISGFDAVPTPVTCFGGSDGTIVASIAPAGPGVNDNPEYEYSINGGLRQKSGIFLNLAAGDYTVEVFSGRGCSDLKLVKVEEPDLIVVPDPVVAQYACTSGNTNNFATITVTGVTGGSENFVNYEFLKNGVRVYFGPRNVYTEMDYAGGDYTINVYDDNGCVGTNAGIWTINPYIRLDKVNVTVNNAITCPTKENITVTVDTVGGIPAVLDYSIAYSSGAAVPGNAPNQTGIFTDLGIGEYIITVVNPATGCIIKKVHNVFDPNTFIIKAVAVNGKICFGTADGSVDLTFVDNQIPDDEAGVFDYVITGPLPSTATVAAARSASAGPENISNLSAGTYKVVATLVGPPFCSVETLFTIDQPNEALVATSSKADITCAAGNNDGEISATATGGWDGNYEYQLVRNATDIIENYSSKNLFTGLIEGVYTINVRDSKGCIASTTQTLIIPIPISATAVANMTMLPCFGDKSGEIRVSPPTGGQGSNYMYTLNVLSENPVISSGPFVSGVFSGLGAGRYSVTITDGFTCEFTTNEVVIDEPTIVKALLVESRRQTCQTLTELTLSAEGGTGPYTYSTDGNTVLGSFATSISFDVPVGSYKYYVKDTNGCISVVSNTVTINALTPLDIKLDVSSAVVKCTGEATAVITAEAVGGLGHYSYTLLNATGGVVRPAQDNGIFADLPIGTYRVAVNSVDCDDISDLISITEPNEALTAQFLPTNVTCFGENNGKLQIIASGGTGIIKYAISPNLNQFDSKVIFEKLAPGDYQAIAQDENGCFVLHDFTITQPNPVIVKEVPNSMIPEVCKDDKDGAFSIEIAGGTAPYSVSLDNAAGPYTQGTPTQTIFDFTNLVGGTHTVYVKDAKNCTTEFVENMPEPVVLNPTAAVSYDCVNNVQANMVVITVDESITNPADVDYSLDGTGVYQPSNVFTNVAVGRHFVIARHTNGCEVPTATFDIVGHDPLVLTLSEEKGIWNVITAAAAGGGGEYVYSIDGVNFSSDNKFKIYKTGTYTITVRDKNGCTDTKDYYIKYVDVCLDNYFTPAGSINTTWGPGCTNIYNNLTFSIFDRYGRVIAKYHYGQKWDGKYNGEDLPSGDYWYVLKLNDENDGREFVGHFTLYR